MPGTLVMIDCQTGFLNPVWGERNNPHFERNAQRLLTHWRTQGWPVVHVRHASKEPNSPLRPDRPGFAFFEWATPLKGEPEVVKQVNSGFIGTDLEKVLRNLGGTDLTVAGLTTNHCVSTTVRMAGNLGFHVNLVGDACATFGRHHANGTFYDAHTMHDTALASLHGEFCIVVTADALVEA